MGDYPACMPDDLGSGAGGSVKDWRMNMKITKIKVKNLFGIAEYEADGASVELSGKNGAGKTSVIDAIRYALTNKSDESTLSEMERPKVKS